jgi:cell division protein ZapA (FtsZ GTPase activity inhibitor)
MQNIDIEIAGKSYPVLADKEEEKMLQLLAEELNGEISDMQRRYGSKLTKQDILSMLLLIYAKKFKDSENNFKLNKINEKIDSLYLMLDYAISLR